MSLGSELVMNKDDIANELMILYNVNKKKALTEIEHVIMALRSVLSQEDIVEVEGLGTFSVVKAPISDKYNIEFKPSSSLIELINK